MSKEMKNDYEKALKLYHKGELKKSLQCCEEGISKNLKNNLVLNLKGLILYLNGDLDGAITVWKINKDFNDDEISKTYIKDAENDRERQKEFEKARKLIKELHINEAIEILNICEESDFNAVQVNNALALCFFKKGDYESSRKYIDKSLKINKCDTNTNAIKKELDSFTETTSKKKILTSIILSLIVVVLIGVTFITSVKNNKKESSQNYVGKSEDNHIVDENNIDNENINEDTGVKDEENKEEAIIDEDNTVEINVTADDIENNYKKASTYFSDKKYDEAKESLTYVLKPSIGNHLNNDIVFLLASTYEKLDDKNNSIKYFEEYISTYKNGEYIEEVYYKLALLYKDIDIVKSKEYASYITYNYPKSIYNNSNIDSILAN